MKKEIIDREFILKAFSDALLLKNKIQSKKSDMLEMYDENGALKPRYTSENAAQIMEELEKSASDYEKALANFKQCFNVTVKEFADFVGDYIKKSYSVRSSIKSEKIPNSNYAIIKLELKAPIPSLGLEKKDTINLAVIDEKLGAAKTNILNSFFVLKVIDKKIPLLHYRSEDSKLLVNEAKNQYSKREFFEITKEFMEEKYLPDDYEVDLE